MYLIILLIAVIIGPVIYIAFTLTGKRAETFEDYHYAGRKIPLSEFIDTTVMYALQVAVLTLFATWGYQYGFWTIWVPLFWGLGYFLVAKHIEKDYFDEFLKQDNLGTIHQFLSHKSNLKLLSVLAALASFLGISGPAMYEASFTGDLISRLISSHLQINEPNLIATYSTLFAFLFILIATTYMLYSGYKAVVRTDVVQLSIGFILMNLSICIILYLLSIKGFYFVSITFSLLLTILLILLFIVWRKYISIKNNIWSIFKESHPIILSMMFYLVSLILTIVNVFNSQTSISFKNEFLCFLNEQKFYEPFSLGLIPLISLLIANGLYQFVDIGQWQRLGSVYLNEEDYENSKMKLSKTVKYVGIYSPITWIIAILLGMSLRYFIPDVASNPFQAFFILLNSLQNDYGFLGQFTVIIFIVSIVSIMLSTLDSLVSSVSFTVHNDWINLLNNKFRSIRLARITSLLLVVIVFVLYQYLSTRVNTFADILYSCWSFQIALTPIIIYVLYKKKIPKITSLVSLVVGMVCSILPIIIGEPLNPYSHAPIFSLLSSSFVFIIGLSLEKGSMKNA